MTTKDGLHFKRNEGNARYTNDWGTINHFRDAVRNYSSVHSKIGGHELIALAYRMVRETYAWRHLSEEQKQEIFHEVHRLVPAPVTIHIKSILGQ
jgi:hypothetical protein